MTQGPGRRWIWLLAWLLLSLFVILAFRDIAWREVLDVVRGASWGWLVLAVMLNGSILILAAFQWVVLLPRPGAVGFGPILWITAVVSTISNGGPFLSGHAAGVYLLATRGRLGYPSALSMKLQEQLVAGITKLLLFGLALALAPLPAGARTGALGLLFLVTIFGIALLLAAHRGHGLGPLAERWPGWVGKLLSFLDTTAGGLEALRRPSAFFLAVALGIGKKGVEGLAIWAVLMALGVTLPFWGVLAVLAAVTLSTMASVTPANVGIYEGSALVALGLCGIGAEMALGTAVTLHLAYLIPLAGCGWVVLLFHPKKNRTMLDALGDRSFQGRQL